MKKIKLQTGGMPLYLDDFDTIQEALLAVAKRYFGLSTSNYIVDGFTITPDGPLFNVSDGIAYINGQFRYFEGGTFASSTLYVVEAADEAVKTRVYASGVSKTQTVNLKCSVTATLPGGTYIALNSTSLRLKDLVRGKVAQSSNASIDVSESTVNNQQVFSVGVNESWLSNFIGQAVLYLEALISAEATTRAQADATLQTNINAKLDKLSIAGARYKLTTDIAVNAGSEELVTLTSKVYDRLGADDDAGLYDTGTGEFTAPADGFYSVVFTSESSDDNATQTGWGVTIKSFLTGGGQKDIENTNTNVVPDLLQQRLQVVSTFYLLTGEKVRAFINNYSVSENLLFTDHSLTINRVF